MSLKSPPNTAAASASAVHNLTSFPREIHLNILTFLRATDLSALQHVARCFNNRDLIVDVVDHCANVVVSLVLLGCISCVLFLGCLVNFRITPLILTLQYPSDLTKGFDTPIVSGEVRSVAVAAKKGKRNSQQQQQQIAAASSASAPTNTTPTERVYTYEMLRNMEMLVVTRVISRPEPPAQERSTGFYVSKSWCRAALRWLEVQEEERKEREERRRAAEEAKLLAAQAASTPKGKGGRGKHHYRKSPHPGSSGKKKLSRKEQRQRDRKLSDAMPPWSNINTDIT